MEKFNPGDKVSVTEGHPSNEWTGEVKGLKEGSRTVYQVQDIDEPKPVKKPGSWSRGTNNDFGQVFERHYSKLKKLTDEA